MIEIKTPSPTGNGSGHGAIPMMPIMLNAQYLKDMSFESPRAPQILMNRAETPQVQVAIDVKARGMGTNVYEVELEIRSEAKNGDDVTFLVEINYAGLFTLNNIAEDSLRPVLFIECARLLFPFARNIIAEVSRDGGFPPLLINPIDFAEMYRQRSAASPGAAPTATA